MAAARALRLLVGKSAIALSKRSPLGRGLFRRSMLAMLDALGITEVNSSFRGAPIHFHLDNNTERKALLSNRYDRAEMDFLCSYLKKPGAVFFDVGANSGLYTMFEASRMKPGSKVISIEPNSEMCRRIEHNRQILLDAKRLDGVEIILEKCALGDRDGELFLETSVGFGSAYVSDVPSPSAVPVSVFTLRHIFEKHRLASIDAMKMDIEGYEDRALIPFFVEMQKSQFPKALLFETIHSDRWNADLVSYCSEIGYKCAGKTRSSILMELS